MSPSFRTLETNAHRPSFFAKPDTKLMHPAHIRWDQYLHRALELSAEPLAHTRFHLAPARKNSQKNTVHDQKSTRLVGCPCPSLLRLSGNEIKKPAKIPGRKHTPKQIDKWSRSTPSIFKRVPFFHHLPHISPAWLSCCSIFYFLRNDCFSSLCTRSSTF